MHEYFEEYAEERRQSPRLVLLGDVQFELVLPAVDRKKCKDDKPERKEDQGCKSACGACSHVPKTKKAQWITGSLFDIGLGGVRFIHDEAISIGRQGYLIVDINERRFCVRVGVHRCVELDDGYNIVLRYHDHTDIQNTRIRMEALELYHHVMYQVFHNPLYSNQSDATIS